MQLLAIEPNQWLEDGQVQMPKGKKAAHFLDLFYDLLLVLAMSTISVDFRTKLEHVHGISLVPVLDVFAFLAPIWLHSMALNAFSNRFGKVESLFTVSFYFLNVICLGLLTANIITCGNNRGLDTDSFACFDFSLFYSLARLLTTAGWIRAAIGTTKGRSFCIRCAAHNATISFLWFILIFLQNSFSGLLAVWWLAVVVDLAFYVVPMIPFVDNFLPKSYVPVDVHLLDERMGLITLIAIGETVAAAAASSHKLETESYISCVLIIGTSFVIMLLYFRSGEIIVKEGKHALRVSKIRGVSWLLLHLPLIFALILSGSVSELLVAGHNSSNFARILYGYSVATVFIISAIMQSLHETPCGRKKKMFKRTRLLLRLLVAILVLAAGFIPREWVATPLLPLGLIFGITASGVLLELWGSTSAVVYDAQALESVNH